jgi:putative phosphoesterase
LLEPITRPSVRRWEILSGGVETVERVADVRYRVLVILSDTHGDVGHDLTDHLLRAVRNADRVVHAGDFTTESVLESVLDAAPRLDAVHGNADDNAVRERLPSERVLEYEGSRIAVTHWKPGGQTGLSMFGRSVGADLVVYGHTHNPGVVMKGDPILVNPGSHTTPRGHRPGYAELSAGDGGLAGTLRALDGTVRNRFSVAGTTPPPNPE